MNSFALFMLLMNEKKNGREFNWKKITREELMELSWNRQLSDSLIAELYDVNVNQVNYKKQKWKLQLRHKIAEQLKQSAAENNHPNLEHYEKLIDEAVGI